MTDATPTHPELRVVAGLHQGAALPLLDAQVTVGCREDCDVILLDEGVQPCHLTLIRAENGRWLNAADQQPIQFGKSISLGQAAIMICEAGSSWQPTGSAGIPTLTSTSGATPPQGWSRAHPLAFRLLCACFGVLCLSGISWVSLYASAPVAPPATSPQQSSSEPPIPGPEQLEQRVRRLFKDWGINDLVQLHVSEKTITIEGVLSPSELQRVNSAVNDIHREWGRGVKVALKIQPLQMSLPFEIKVVFYGPVSNITLLDGTRLFVGDSHLGVRLSEIRPGLMVFDGQRRIEVTW